MSTLCFSILCLMAGKCYGDWCYKKYLIKKSVSKEPFYLDGEQYRISLYDKTEYIDHRSTIPVTKQYEI